MALKLSDESFQTDYDINLKCSDTFKIGKWLTDGAMAIDTTKVYKDLKNAKDVSAENEDYFLSQCLNNKVLKKVLNNENRVTFLPCSYKGYRLVNVNNKELLIDSFYANEIDTFEVFYFNQTFYFFEYLEAEPEAEIYEDAYMLIGLVRGIKQNNDFMFKVSGILYKLNEFLKKLESEA